jgi:hypothetical protein
MVPAENTLIFKKVSSFCNNRLTEDMDSPYTHERPMPSIASKPGEESRAAANAAPLVVNGQNDERIA